MGLFSFLKKKEIPEELPDLATDEIEKKLEKDKDLVADHIKNESEDSKLEDKKKKEDITEEKPIEKNSEKKDFSAIIPKKSFFDDLEKNIHEELDDLDKLEDWYENKFMPQDVVSSMRNYWENQKNNSVLQILGKNFKERINEKTKLLQAKEKEWQNIYFDLIEKEEEIREEEEELKRILSEFVELCRRKKKITQTTNDEKKKGKKKTS